MMYVQNAGVLPIVLCLFGSYKIQTEDIIIFQIMKIERGNKTHEPYFKALVIAASTSGPMT